MTRQGGVGIENMDLGSNFLLTGLRLNQPANVIRHVSILGNNDVIRCHRLAAFPLNKPRKPKSWAPDANLHNVGNKVKNRATSQVLTLWRQTLHSAETLASHRRFVVDRLHISVLQSLYVNTFPPSSQIH